MENSSPLDLIAPLYLVNWSFVISLLYCNLGETMTKQFDGFNNGLSCFNWYFLSVKMQKLLVIVMANTQTSIHIRGYGNIKCTREAFKKVKIHWENLTL